MVLTHYVVVRRDLPLGVLLAAVAHAAGESFYALDRLGLQAGLTDFNANETIAIVLGARNERRLQNLWPALVAANLPYVPIVETDGEFKGQLLAIGLVPMEKARVGDVLKDFHMLRELDT